MCLFIENYHFLKPLWKILRCFCTSPPWGDMTTAGFSQGQRRPQWWPQTGAMSPSRQDRLYCLLGPCLTSDPHKSRSDVLWVLSPLTKPWPGVQCQCQCQGRLSCWSTNPFFACHNKSHNISSVSFTPFCFCWATPYLHCQQFTQEIIHHSLCGQKQWPWQSLCSTTSIWHMHL